MNHNNFFLNKTSSIVMMLLALFSCCSTVCRGQQAQELITVSGNVISDVNGSPLHGANLTIKGTRQQVKTDSLGHFVISSAHMEGTIIVSHIGHLTTAISFSRTSKGPFRVRLVADQLGIEEVVINTGYQYIPRERATGSFDHIDNGLINRSVSTDIISRLENLSPGLLFNRGDAGNTDPFLIRGRSTITADAQPLIVLDDFPYDGDLNNINPNDIESVSILKDAAAASIWGARAGNGVIVITTKKGSTATPKVELVSNVTFTPKPDLRNINQISAAERIEVERYLFENGRYDAAANASTLNGRTTAIPEAVELMIGNSPDLQSKLDILGSYDVLDDLSRYFYRTSANQQHNLNISGRQDKLNYYLSGGFDRNLTSLVGEANQRVSIRSSNTYRVNDRLSFDAAINFFHVQESSGNNNGVNTSATSQFSLSPYARLADSDGNALPVYIPRRSGYIDTAGNGRLLDWNYRPLDEIRNEEHVTKRRDYMVNVGSNYRVMDGLDALVKYQFQNQLQDGTSLFRESSFYARNNINDLTQINPSTGEVTYPFPRGAILWRGNTATTAHQGRAQLNYGKEFNGRHSFSGLAGFEIRQLVRAISNFQNIGYDENTGNMTNVIDAQTFFPRFSTISSSRVQVTDYTNEMRDNFISYFSNMAYTFDKRYTFLASFRKDEANLFGLNSNQKGTPLWSAGCAWEMGNERFYRFKWLPYVKLRAAYGVNGNISRSAIAIATIYTSKGGVTHAMPTAYLNSPPNRNLSWEQVRQLNLGLDFGTQNQRVTGTVEYYHKDASDLLAQTPVDPTYGASSMHLNVADMSGRGLDIQINTVNLDGGVTWQTNWVYSRVLTKVTNYLMPVAATGRTYLPISMANPLEGKPLYSVFALPWRGLDRGTGNPVGLVDGKESMDYNAIYNGTSLENMQFFGTAQPTHFGAIRNTLNYQGIEVSFNISFKLGYYFRRSSLNYSDMYQNNRGHSDYSFRWQQPGDELVTDVPSRTFPAVPSRDNFYTFSAALVEKGDHIRLEDLNIGYSIQPKRVVSSIRLFAYFSNLGVIWKANDRGIDPYYNHIPLQRPNFSFGTNINF